MILEVQSVYSQRQRTPLLNIPSMVAGATYRDEWTGKASITLSPPK